MKEEIGLRDEERRGLEKKNPKADHYERKCRPGQSAWETALTEFRSMISVGEDPLGSAPQSVETALKQIRQGNQPPQTSSFGFKGSREGWTVTVRNSTDDGRPTIELFYRYGNKGKRIKIRYGGKD